MIQTIDKIDFSDIAHALGIYIENSKESEFEKDKHLPEKFNRNNFFTGDSNCEKWDYLVKIGYATTKDHFCQDTKMVYYYVSEKGIEAFRAYFKAEVTDKFTPPKKSRQKYLDFLNSDGWDNFADYLGICKPKVESKRIAGVLNYKLTSTNPKHKDSYKSYVFGTWETTLKAAKASYKEALKKWNKRTQ